MPTIDRPTESFNCRQSSTQWCFVKNIFKTKRILGVPYFLARAPCRGRRPSPGSATGSIRNKLPQDIFIYLFIYLPMHIQIKNTMRATLKYMQLVDCKSGHSPLLTAIHKFKYNIAYNKTDNNTV